MQQSIVLIPAYQPNAALPDLVRALLTKQKESFAILVVNDGSTGLAVDVIDTLRSTENTIVLDHAKNKGKGAALKTGLEYVLTHFPDATCVVTADADGQHAPEDILRVLDTTIQINKPVIGIREFGKDVPFRSWFGNTLTRSLFKLFFRTSITDTQSGLRGIPLRFASDLLEIEADRYSFEFEALIHFVRTETLVQIPIQTIYEPGNPTSHFNPLLDSARIYAVFLRHAATVFLVAAIDYLIFMLALWSGVTLFWALAISRSVSVLIYFFTAKRFVFRSTGNPIMEAAFFLLLVGLNLILLWPLIEFLNEALLFPYALAMPIGNLLLFGSNFLWQFFVVFARRERA